MVIFKSNLKDFSNLNRWTSLTKIVLKESTYDCNFLIAVENLDIELQIDHNYCIKTSEINMSTLSTDDITPQSQTKSIESKHSSNILNTGTTQASFHQNFSNTYTTAKALSNNSKSSDPHLKYIIGGAIVVFLSIPPIIFTLIYLCKKKVKVSRLPPNLPSGSQLELADPSVSIEMDSFESFDFHSSNPNIYEVPNPIYSNV
jgi:hypothetical protein